MLKPKFRSTLYTLLFLGLTGFVSCTFENEENYFNPVCDTTAIVYNDLTYIFTDVCASCHVSATETPRPGIVMSNYEQVKASILTGKVLPAIKHESIYKMPAGQAKLSDCDIEKVEAWINAGMPEN
jgi:hypothetical protein